MGRGNAVVATLARGLEAVPWCRTAPGPLWPPLPDLAPWEFCYRGGSDFNSLPRWNLDLGTSNSDVPWSIWGGSPPSSTPNTLNLGLALPVYTELGPNHFFRAISSCIWAPITPLQTATHVGTHPSRPLAQAVPPEDQKCAWNRAHRFGFWAGRDSEARFGFSTVDLGGVGRLRS